MVKVLCTGGESTGTRLATRIIDSLGHQGIHRSVPYDRTKGRPLWPTLYNIDFDRAIVMTRDWWAVAGSQVAASHSAHEDQAVARLRRAYKQIAHDLDRVADRPWIMLSYESLVQRPEQVVGNLADWLGCEYRGLPEPVVDGNTKWLGALRRACSFSV